MADKQLNVWIQEELRDYVSDRAKQERKGMNTIIAEMIQRDMAARHGEMIENNSLAVVREMIGEELRQAHAQLRSQLRNDRAAESEDEREWLKKQIDQVAALTVMSIRNAGIARRLVYAVLSKSFGPAFAKSAADNAKEKAQLELLPKKTVKEHVQGDEAAE